MKLTTSRSQTDTDRIAQLRALENHIETLEVARREACADCLVSAQRLRDLNTKIADSRCELELIVRACSQAA